MCKGEVDPAGVWDFRSDNTFAPLLFASTTLILETLLTRMHILSYSGATSSAAPAGKGAPAAAAGVVFALGDGGCFKLSPANGALAPGASCTVTAVFSTTGIDEAPFHAIHLNLVPRVHACGQ